MAHVITFHNERYGDVMVKMINKGYAPMMKTEGNTEEYFKSFQGENRFYSFENRCYVGGGAEDIDISFGAPDAKTDWNGVMYWLWGKQDELPLIKPVKVKAVVKEDVPMRGMGSEDKYMYDEQVVDGVFYAEIIKPEINQEISPAYTVVIEDWRPEKMMFMFSSICSVPSFGVLYPEDRNFIVSLWKWKGMPGEFSLQDLCDAHMKAVELGVTHEPVVYRKPVGEIIDRFNEKSTGSKRKLFEVPPK